MPISLKKGKPNIFLAYPFLLTHPLIEEKDFKNHPSTLVTVTPSNFTSKVIVTGPSGGL